MQKHMLEILHVWSNQATAASKSHSIQKWSDTYLGSENNMPSSSDTHRITQFNIVFHEPEEDWDE